MQFLNNEQIINMLFPLIVNNGEWEEHKKDNTDYIENIYFTLGEIARYVLGAIQNNDTNNLKKIFDSIELVFIMGDKVSQEKISTGLIEPLQNNMLNSNIELSSIDNYLNPQTKQVWGEIISGWNPENK
jgi:hypothetical protein